MAATMGSTTTGMQISDATKLQKDSNVLTVSSLHSNNENILNNLNAAKEDNSGPTQQRLFNKIVLSLENSFIPEQKIEVTPSRQDGLDIETEKDLRILGCELIQTAGILLKLPQVAMATGQVLFQRFFYSKSFVRNNMETVAMSCVYLASKIEEEPRRIRDVINVFHHIKQVRAQKMISPMILEQYYTNLKSQVIRDERKVLKELGFCVHVKHPHKMIVMYLQVLQYEKHEKLMQMSWNFMNDSLRTDVFMRYTPETIACACIHLSARKLNIPLPNSPPWYGIFQVSMVQITDICYRVMELYTRPKPIMEKLVAVVEQLKKQIEARNQTLEVNNPPAVSTVDPNNSSHKDTHSQPRSHTPTQTRSLSRERANDKLHRDRGRERDRNRERERERSRYSLSRERERSRYSRSRSVTKHYSRSPKRSLSPHSKHRREESSRNSFDYYLKKDRSSYTRSNNVADCDKYRKSSSNSSKAHWIHPFSHGDGSSSHNSHGRHKYQDGDKNRISK